MPSPMLALVFDRPWRRRAKKPSLAGASGASAAATGCGSGCTSSAGSGSGSASGSGSGGTGSARTGTADAMGGSGSAVRSDCTASASAVSAAWISAYSASGWLSSGGSLAGGSAAGACGFLRSQPNRPFFSPGSAGVFLSSFEPNMEKIFSRMRNAGSHAAGWTGAILAPPRRGALSTATGPTALRALPVPPSPVPCSALCPPCRPLRRH